MSVMAIDYAAIAAAGGIGKGTPSRVAKDRKKAQLATAIKHAYKEVDARDKLISWVSGKKLVRGAASDNVRLEHHHLDRRSQSKARQADPFNVISVSASEADYLDFHYLIPVNKAGEVCHDTRKIADFHWNRNVIRPKCEPFKVKATIR